MTARFSLPSFAGLPPDASTRTKILAAAAELLLTDGFAVLTQQAVAARAGVRQSHLTYYFPSRNDLLRATAQYGVETLLDIAAITVSTGPPSVDDFRQLLMPDKSDREWFRLMTGLLVASDQDDTIRHWLREFDERIVEKLADGFAAVGIPVNSDQLHFLHATFIGALHLDMHEQTDESFAKVVRTMAIALDVVMTASPLNPDPLKMPVTAQP